MYVYIHIYTFAFAVQIVGFSLISLGLRVNP